MVVKMAKNCRLSVVMLVLAGLGCGRDDSAPDLSLDLGPDVAGSVIQTRPEGRGAAVDPLSPSVSQFVQGAKGRLKQHEVRIDGLSFLSDEYGDVFFDPGLMGQLREMLAEGLDKIQRIQVAASSEADTLCAELDTLLQDMDRLYDMAMEGTSDIETLPETNDQVPLQEGQDPAADPAAGMGQSGQAIPLNPYGDGDGIPTGPSDSESDRFLDPEADFDLDRAAGTTPGGAWFEDEDDDDEDEEGGLDEPDLGDDGL